MIEIIEWIGLLSLPAFLLLDLVHRAKRYDAPRGWRIRALAVTVFAFFFATKVGELWDGALGSWSLIDGAALGTAGGALVGILVYELFHYGYHRLAHRVNFIWRNAHQMHHSAESLDAFGANYSHPTDIVVWTTLPVLVLVPLLGLAPEAIAIVAAFIAFNAAFQHANIRTPRWLGYLIQRPESHAIHHARGVHRYNYSDLPLWDMVFRTFRNPERFEREQGFYKGASARIGAMLIGRDVSRPPRGKPAPARAPKRLAGAAAAESLAARMSAGR
jgi:sterol desaturase/sphingolipid hydroxylase (fatty acid hydroxylase superfamily)